MSLPGTPLPLLLLQPCPPFHSSHLLCTPTPFSPAVRWPRATHTHTPTCCHSLICAEIPDPAAQPELYALVAKCMVHGG